MTRRLPRTSLGVLTSLAVAVAAAFSQAPGQRPANLRHLAAYPSRPSVDHIHTVVRTPNGNDYGKDLLRQHLEGHAHRHAH